MFEEWKSRYFLIVRGVNFQRKKTWPALHDRANLSPQLYSYAAVVSRSDTHTLGLDLKGK